MAKKTFEAALARLEQITAELESGELNLDKSLDKFSEGVGLARFCSAKLEEAKGRVELLLNNDGELESLPFDGEDDGD